MTVSGVRAPAAGRGAAAGYGYKRSCAPGVGQIPEHWNELPGLAVLREKQVRNVGLVETTVLSLSYGRIVVRPEEKLRGLVPESFETYQIVEDGDIIIRPTDLQNDKTSLRVGLACQRGIITSAYLCLQPRGALRSDYAYRLLHAYDEMKVFYGLGSGLRQNLDYNDFRRLPIIVPPVDEQEHICRFLDHMDRRINRLIRAKRRMIELLSEQKQAIINRAVTRGLDPDVRLKPSGVEWLGDVPEHWEVLRLRYVLREVDVRSTTGTETHLSMSQRLGLVPNAEIEERRLISESYVGAKLCCPGDIVLNRLKAHLGVFALSAHEGLVSPDYTVLRFQRAANKRYFEALLRTPTCRVELRKRTKGIVQGFWRLYTDDLYDIALPVPPDDEQAQVMAFLDDELATVNKTVDRVEREIELVREYRTRLIADVVTGKLDVRGIELLPLEDDEPLHGVDATDEREELLGEEADDAGA